MIRSLKNFFHLFEAIVANLYYGFPSRQLTVIGITGTDGKTTTTHLIYHILKTAGFKASMISSVHATVAGRQYDTGFHVTTPSVFPLQGFMKESVVAGEEYFVLETTAHAIDQKRIWGINYALSVVTNVTHEHLHSKKGLDYFESYDNYLKVKARLFFQSKVAILNKDDQSYKSFLSLLDQRKLIVKTYSLKKPAIYNWHSFLTSNLPGIYNQYNVLAAYSVCDSLGIDRDIIAQGIKTFTPPKGRFDIIYEGKFRVIVDFAHTINAIDQLLKTLKKIIKSPDGRIIHVFGSAGLRDTTKRPLMGSSSGASADVVILTEEDFRSENPVKIAQEIAIGLEKHKFMKVHPDSLGNTSRKTYTIIPDRQQAIAKAVAIAQNADIVVVTGKGHETSLARGNKEIPWDERKAVINALKRYKHDHIR